MIFQSLEDLSIEKQTMMTRLEKEIQSLKEKSATRERELTEQHTSQVQQLNQAHSQSLEMTKKKADDQLTQTKEVGSVEGWGDRVGKKKWEMLIVSRTVENNGMSWELFLFSWEIKSNNILQTFHHIC